MHMPAHAMRRRLWSQPVPQCTPGMGGARGWSRGRFALHGPCMEGLLRRAHVLLPLRPLQMVDVGCGIGGSSRYIARKYGCSARGITLSPVQASQCAPNFSPA